MVLAADPEQSGSGVFGYGKLTRYTLLPYFKFCNLFITGWSTLWQDISLVFLYIVPLSLILQYTKYYHLTQVN
jgi:hypothetical protein